MKRPATPLAAAILLMLFGSVTVVTAQTAMDRAPSVPLVFGFETLEDTSFFNANYTNSTDPRSYFNFDVLPGAFGINPVEGTGAIVVDWGMYADRSFGGSNGIGHFLPASYLPDSLDRLYDISDFTHVSLSYNVLQPASRNMTFRLKLHDASLGIGTEPGNQTEDWNAENTSLLQDAPIGQWKQWTVPLTNLGIGVNPPNNGFTRPGCASGGDPATGSGCWSGLLGNEMFDLDQISAFSFEFFAGTGVQTGDSTSQGVVAFDNLRVSGVRYDLLSSFDTPSAVGGWANGGSTRTITAVSDTVQGSGALEFDYHLTGGESWGGSIDVQVPASGSGYPNLTARTALSIFYKVVEPVSTTDGDPRLVFKLFENSTGVSEEWQFTTRAVLGDTTGQWRRLIIPLNEFTLPSWVAQGDATFNPDKIADIQFQIFGNAGADVTGKIIFDRFTTYGLQITDNEAPVAVSSFSVEPSEYSNLVVWSDLDGEEGETYDLFYSLSEITDVEAEGVYSLAIGVAGGTEVYLHDVYAPRTDQPITYYYAIRPTDQVGNTGPMTTTGGVTNTGRGIPTISMTPPSSFVADGNLGEWSAITPIHLEPNGVLGYIPQTTNNYAIDGASDLSADVYLAVDDEAIYVALNVTDNIVSPVPDGVTDSRWLYDGAELYIGLYNELHTRHANLRTTGNEPDYKFYLYKAHARTDGRDNVATPDSSTYNFTQTANGYVIEAKLKYANFAFDGVPAFTPENGMRIPLDIVIMDNDEPGTQAREGILTYSFKNDDNSYLSPRNWSYNWIGDRISTGVEQIGETIPQRFALGQNFPNPASASTRFVYDLPQAGPVKVTVYNALGQQVATLVDADQPAGQYEVNFDARSLASGVYFYRLQAGAHTQAKTMLIAH